MNENTTQPAGPMASAIAAMTAGLNINEVKALQVEQSAWEKDQARKAFVADMAAFMAEYGRVVCKPLYGMGGRSVFVLELGDKNANVVFETLTEFGQRYAIVQRYIPDIVQTGDSRILLIDGELQREGSVVNLVARDVRPLPEVAAEAGGPDRPSGVRQMGMAGMRRLG